MGNTDNVFLDKLLASLIRRKKIYSAVLCVESGDGRFSWTGAAGNMQADSRYFLTSVTKLYVTAVVIRLIENEFLGLDDKISNYLPEHYVSRIHRINGVDRSEEITVRSLLSNTSGLPDYFFQKNEDGYSAADQLLSGKDEPWDLDKAVQAIKSMQAKFPPEKKGKAFYSDTNYKLLERIIENVTGKPIGLVFREHIFEPLQLKNTYLYVDINDKTPVPFYYKSKKLWLPEYVASTKAEGIVTTAEECMLFLKAFFQGYLFPIETIDLLKRWNLILPPQGLFYYGVGIEKLWIPMVASPFKPLREVMGFWGQTGSFAWYNPDTDLYICGTTNQADGTGHTATARVILKMIKKAW